jgi:hypothetical protein
MSSPMCTRLRSLRIVNQKQPITESERKRGVSVCVLEFGCTCERSAETVETDDLHHELRHQSFHLRRGLLTRHTTA